MSVNVGWTYKFTFTNDFSSLNGVYSVVKIYTYDELINDGIDLNDGLYAHVGKTSEQLDSDVGLYRNEDIYKLVNPDDSAVVYYAPAPILMTIPDPNIAKYSKLVLGVNLGIFDNQEQLASVISTLQEILSKTVGIVETPQLFSVGHKWLTPDEYATIEAERITASREVVNYFSETQKLLETVSKQQTQISVLSNHIKNLSECLCNQTVYPD